MSEQKELKGVLFKNDRKETDKQPDYKGSARVGAKDFWLSAWINTSKTDGKKYMSLSFKEKEASAEPAPQQQEAGYLDDDAEIPF